MVVEAKELILLLLVLLEGLLKLSWVAFPDDLSGATVEAVTILWKEGLDADSSFLISDDLRIVDSTTVLADSFGLFEGYLHVIRNGKVNKGVQTTFVLLEHLSLSHILREVGEDEAIPSSTGDSKHFESDSFPLETIPVLII